MCAIESSSLLSNLCCRFDLVHGLATRSNDDFVMNIFIQACRLLADLKLTDLTAAEGVVRNAAKASFRLFMKERQLFLIS